jgi:hypothetical protein
VFYRFARDAVWLTVRWYKPGGRYRIDELAEECTKILMEGYARPQRQNKQGVKATRRRSTAAP